MEKDIKKNTKLTLLVVILILIVIITTSTYAYYKTRIKSPGSKISIMGSNFSLNITDNSLVASDLTPIYDKNKATQGVKKEFTISIGSTGVTSACYDLYIDVTSLGENLRNKYFKYELTNGTDTYTGSFNGRTDGSQILIIRNQNINTTNTSNSYTLYLWLSYSETENQITLLKGSDASRTFKGRILAKAITGTCKESDTDPTMYTVNLFVINGSSDKKQQEILKGKNTTFTITPNDGYTLEDATVNCDGGTLVDNTLTVTNVQKNTTCVVQLGEKGLTLAQQILVDNPTIEERTDFSVINTSATTGIIYKTNKTEDESEVYYYSGNITNNWVKFGGFYWRIIRTNEDGSIRLLYSGTGHNTTSADIGDENFNSNYMDPLKAGYMYGTSGSLAKARTNKNNSAIKSKIDKWYQNNLLENYDKYISKTAIYCNDRSVGSGSYTSDSGIFNFGAFVRLSTNKTPTYKCGGDGSGGLFETTQAIEDKFSASTDGGGNGQLTYPIALMTADEASFAGGIYALSGLSATDASSWIYVNSSNKSITKSSSWWLMSPSNSRMTMANVFCIMYPLSESLTEPYIGSQLVDTNSTGLAVRPVISLSVCVKVESGNGTPENPYEIDETSCS